MEPRTQYARTSEGVNIAYAVFGTGPAIIFPSHMFGSLHLYKERGNLPRIYDELASLGWSAITYDGRGCGSSDRDVSDYSMEARLRDLDAVIERVAPAQFSMCGVIQGGPAAIAYSVLHPDRVTNLVLSNTFAFGPEWYEVVPAMRAFRKMASMAEDDWEFFTLSVGSAVTNHSDAEAARKAAEAFRAGMTPKAWTDYQEEAELVDLRGILPEIAPPTLVVHDRSFPLARVADVVKRLTAMIPNAQFVETDDLAKVIDEFLREGGLNPVMGAPAAASRPSTFRTILFTDLVGHTEMMRRLGDEKGRDVLREHENIMRDVLKSHGGIEVKTMGDGFMASFGSVTKGVECAIALQRAFAERNASADEPLNVRVGLNAGEPIEEEGDLFGSTVILAARIAAAAQGGEVLASMAVRELCAGKPFLFADRGDHVVRGFEDLVRMFEVSWRN